MNGFLWPALTYNYAAMVGSGADTAADVSQDDVTKRPDTFWQKLKYSRPMNYEVGTLAQKLLATWASPFLDRGSKVSALDFFT